MLVTLQIYMCIYTHMYIRVCMYVYVRVVYVCVVNTAFSKKQSLTGSIQHRSGHLSTHLVRGAI